MPLTEQEFWRVTGLINAHGDVEAARMLGVTIEELCRGLWPGTDASVVATIRERLAGIRIAGRT